MSNLYSIPRFEHQSNITHFYGKMPYPTLSLLEKDSSKRPSESQTMELPWRSWDLIYHFPTLETTGQGFCC